MNVNPLPSLFNLPDFSLVFLPIYSAGVCRIKDTGSIGSRVKRYGSGKGTVPDKIYYVLIFQRKVNGCYRHISNPSPTTPNKMLCEVVEPVTAIWMYKFWFVRPSLPTS
jgi:hypothetical protein